jgi:uncharacterized phiE125 gp8 family phage protein
MTPRIRAISVLVPALEPVLELFTLEEAKIRAGVGWAAGDVREPLLMGFVAAARSKVEQDTGLALVPQTRDIYLDGLPPFWAPLVLPAQSMPLQDVVSITSTDSAGVVSTLDPSNYVVDLARGRIGLAYGGAWPSDLGPGQSMVIRIVAGYATPAALAAAAPLLLHAVGLLTAHYATVGRDLTTVGTIITTTPQGYDDAISSYVPVTLA